MISSQPRYVLLRCPNFFARCSLRKISTAATPFCSLHPPPAAVANVPTSISPSMLNPVLEYNDYSFFIELKLLPQQPYKHIAFRFFCQGLFDRFFIFDR